MQKIENLDLVSRARAKTARNKPHAPQEKMMKNHSTTPVLAQDSGHGMVGGIARAAGGGGGPPRPPAAQPQ